MTLRVHGLRSNIYQQAPPSLRLNSLPQFLSPTLLSSSLATQRRRHSDPETNRSRYQHAADNRVVRRGLHRARQHVQSAITECDSRPGCSSRISIVGAGPAGLFAAICLCLKYGRLSQASSGKIRFRRNHPFPSIQLYERRSRSDWGKRQQLIVLQHSVQTLLSRLLYTTEFQENTMEISRIEKTLRHLLERVFRVRIVEREIQGNRDLLNDGTDVIIWAGGKSSPSPAIRSLLSMKYITGQRDLVLVFTFDQGFVTRLQQIIHLLPIHAPIRMLIRPGPRPDQPARLWLVGVHTDTLHPELDHIQYDSMRSAWNATGLNRAVSDLIVAIESRIGSISCHVQVVSTGYCRANQPIAYVADDEERHIPVLLIGDAAFCKPFYTGTTLNNHLNDVHSLIMNTDWNSHNINSHDHTAFRFYQRLFEIRIQGPRFTELHRKIHNRNNVVEKKAAKSSK